MTGHSLPAPALRPMLPDDGPRLADIFRESIEDLTGEDYSPSQQEAWMAAADDEEAFTARLAANLTLIATIAGTPVGFASLKGADHIDMLFVHPAAARQGVGMLLVDALERIAAARGTATLVVDASDTALPLFERRGYVALRRNTVPREGEWLGNTTLQKTLTPQPAPPPSETRQ